MEPAKTRNQVVAEIKPAAAVAIASAQASVPEFVLSAGVRSSPSGLSANKYILLVLLVIGAAAAAVFYLR